MCSLRGHVICNTRVKVRQDDGYLIHTTQVVASGTNSERRATRQAFAAALLMVPEGFVVYDPTIGLSHCGTGGWH